MQNEARHELHFARINLSEQGFLGWIRLSVLARAEGAKTISNHRQ